MKKNTKHSLLLSVVALILCCALLAGTTLAWFTDSASSGVNTIQAGNLDIEVYHTNVKVTSKETIDGNTKLFQDKDGNAMKWEPGAVSYETFTVENEGSLALKYKLAMNILDYNALDGHTLKEVLKVKVLTGAAMLSTVDRASVMALDWNTADTLDVFNTGGNLEAGESDLFQVIVYWAPGANDNILNVNNGKRTTDGLPLFISFGINVVASQLNYENDSFGPNYDQGIALPDLPVSVNKTFQSAPITTETVTESVEVKNVSTNIGVATVQADSVNAVIDALKGQATDKAEGSDLSTVIYLDVQTTDKTETSVTYEIDMSATLTYRNTNGETKTTTLESLNGKLAGKIVTATMDIGKGLSNVTVKHYDMPMTQLASADTDAEGYYYNKATGVLTIKSKSFSPFTVDYTIEGVAAVGDTTYSTLEEALKAANDGDTVVLLKDVTLTSDLQLGGNGKSLTLHLNKHTIDGGEYQVYTAGVGTISICGGGTILNTNTTQNADYAPLRIYQYSSIVLDDVTVNGEYCAVKNSGNLTVKKANITGKTFGLGCFLDGTTVIGQLDGNNSDIIVTAKEQALAIAAATGYSGMNVTVYSGTFTSSGTDWDDCPAYWAGHGTLNVYGGTFKNETSSTGAAGLLQKNGTVNVFGGTFEARDGIKLVAQSDSTEIVNAIQGGAFTGTRSGIYIDASNSTYMGRLSQYSVSIANNGDTVPQFVGGTEKAIYTKTGGLGDRTLMTISSGSFNEDPTAYLADGKMAVVGENGMFNVITDTRVKNEEQLKAAVEAGGEVTLGADIQLTASLNITKDVTLNLGQYKITGKEKAPAIVLKCDSGVVKAIVNAISGGVIGNGSNGDCFEIPWYNEGTVELTVNGGSYQSSNGYFADINAGSSTPDTRKDKLYINGGTYTGTKIININPANTEIVMTAGSLTGTGSGITFGANSTNAKFAMSGGAITYESGSVITAQASGNTVDISENAVVTGKLSLTNCTMNIHGGIVNITGISNDNRAIKVNDGTTLNIRDSASVKGDPLFLMYGGTVNITGGRFKGKIVNGLNYGENYKQSVENLLTSDYQLSEPDSDGWYQVIPVGASEG